ncbi:MAG: hypothetical protein DSY42_00595 [Aquifex sp.]|nr:MAG: hypothetical protein DSY42_00595 [Aquifex sp.]
MSKVKKIIYLDEEVSRKLEKLERMQSQLINDLLSVLFSCLPPEEIVFHKIRDGSFHKIPFYLAEKISPSKRKAKTRK